MKIKNTFEKNFLNNKNILITGASKGIGKELAVTLSSYGANIILHGRDEQALDKGL
jgi:short-subunit dehydrogenase